MDQIHVHKVRTFAFRMCIYASFEMRETIIIHVHVSVNTLETWHSKPVVQILSLVPRPSPRLAIFIACYVARAGKAWERG